MVSLHALPQAGEARGRIDGEDGLPPGNDPQRFKGADAGITADAVQLDQIDSLQLVFNVAGNRPDLLDLRRAEKRGTERLP